MPRLLSALEPEVVVSASLVEGSVEGVSKRMGMGRGDKPPSWPPDLKCGSVTTLMVSYLVGWRLVAVSGINVES